MINYGFLLSWGDGQEEHIFCAEGIQLTASVAQLLRSGFDHELIHVTVLENSFGRISISDEGNNER